MSSFQIADCPTSLVLAAGGAGKPRRGKLSLTVRNVSGSMQTARISVESVDGADLDWFAIEEAPSTSPRYLERDFVANATQTITINITVPESAQAGSYSFRARATSEANPDDDYVEGPSVSLVVPATAPVERRKINWWLIAAPIAAVVVIAIGVIVFTSGSPPEPLRVSAPPGTPLPAALAQLEADGLVAEVPDFAQANQAMFQVVSTRPENGAEVEANATVALEVAPLDPRGGDLADIEQVWVGAVAGGPIDASTLSPRGFFVDPERMPMILDPGVPPNTLQNNNCDGFISAQPSYRWTLEGDDVGLLWVVADSPVSLIIRTVGNGTNSKWFCLPSLGPLLDKENPPVTTRPVLLDRGEYDIWVGSPVAGETGMATIMHSSDMDISLQNFDMMALVWAMFAAALGDIAHVTAGVTPTPLSLTTAFIDTNSEVQDVCGSSVATGLPAYIVRYVPGDSGLTFRVVHDDDQDFVLAVRVSPSKDWVCGGALTPDIVRFDDPVDGYYELYIGATESLIPPTVTILLSED